MEQIAFKIARQENMVTLDPMNVLLVLKVVLRALEGLLHNVIPVPKIHPITSFIKSSTKQRALKPVLLASSLTLTLIIFANNARLSV